ncbi:hypothetical protein ACFUJU_31915 [Streptomyces sp. NPDC057235]|uniref:hypothetical protein n=1 Tax=Streptomyces sp. NPDC057235 TaxID=3346058 RepID=UPI00363D892C
MLFTEIQNDERVIATTPRGTAHGTVLAAIPADRNPSGRDVVLVALDKGGKPRTFAPASLSPLTPEQDPRDPDAAPRMWRRDTGWLFWRGGRAYLAYFLIDTWRVIEWHDDPDAYARLISQDHRTRQGTVAEAIEKIDARLAMHWHTRAMPSLRGGELPDGLSGEGWEVWRVPGPMDRHEVTYYGDLVGAVELHPAGWAVVEYNADGEAFPVSYGVPHIERAAMLVHASLPFAQ